MQYDYFIASRWRSRENVLDLAEKIRKKGKTVYCFIQGDGEIYELKDQESKLHPDEHMKQFESRDWQNDPAVKEIFEVDMNALKKSERLILLLPAGKSAHIEAGAAYGMGKQCILIGQQDKAESSYVIFTKAYKDIDSFISSLS